MTRAELRQIVWEELQKSLHIVLTGVSQNTDGVSVEDIQSLLPGVPTIPQRPVAFPWGYNAGTPDQVSQLILMAGNSPQNRIVAGHFDSNRPPVNPGENCLYNQYGQQIRLQQGKIVVGTPAATQPFVLGLLWQALENAFISAFNNHTHPPGTFATAPTGGPVAGVSGTPSSSFDGNTDDVLSDLIVGE